MQRLYRELIALLKLERQECCIIVEGLSDKLFLEDYLAHIGKKRITVYSIDEIDLEDAYKSLPADKVEVLLHNNKERIVFMAGIIEQILGRDLKNILCIVDLDMDRVLNCETCQCYLTYTDYNCMESYLMNEDTILRILTRPLRITKNVDIPRFLDSLLTVGRILFHIRCLLHARGKRVVDNNRDLSFNKELFVLNLNFNDFWRKNIVQNGFEAQGTEALFNERMAKDVNVKMEVRGHDFVKCLFYSVKHYKSIGMDEESFSNILWNYVDFDSLSQEPLFKRIMNL